MSPTKGRQDDQRTADPRKRKQEQPPKGASTKMVVPVGDGFSGQPGSSVFISDDGVIYEAVLQKTNIVRNNNKSCHFQIIVDPRSRYWLLVRSGRTGSYLNPRTTGPYDCETAVDEFCQKFVEKTGIAWESRFHDPKPDKYAFLQKQYEELPESLRYGREADGEFPMVLPVESRKLVGLIFNEQKIVEALENIGFDHKKMPLGRLGERAITRGYQILGEITDLIGVGPSGTCRCGRCLRKKTDDEAVETNEPGHYDTEMIKLTDRFYCTIPHAWGRDRLPIIKDQSMVEKEIQMLDELRNMEAAGAMIITAESKDHHKRAYTLFKQLNLSEMTVLSHTSTEFSLIELYLNKTSAPQHHLNYTVEDIFRIERHEEIESFLQFRLQQGRNNSTRRLLWHGSRTTNFGGILSKGLRITPPEAPHNGSAFGKGVYFADVSSKSANYCQVFPADDTGLLLLCEVELGPKTYDLFQGSRDAEANCKQAGCIATKGIGTTAPKGWIDASCVHKSLKGVLMPDPSQGMVITMFPGAYLGYNEYIVYDIAQVKLRYLVRTHIKRTGW